MLTIPGRKGNKNQNYTKVPPLLEWVSSRTPTTTNVVEDLGKKKLSYTAGGNAS
jgi:hypothetical protein